MTEELALPRFLFADTRSAWLWAVIRLYLGWQWLSVGLAKVVSTQWVGSHAGGALTGFLQNALAKTGGAHPDVQWWYAWFLEHAIMPYPTLWSHIIAYGELFVGIGLLLGFLTGISAFFGMFMNLNYLLAGTVSVNPIWLLLSIGLILAWRVSGYIGLDRYVLPLFRTYILRKSIKIRT